MNDAGMMTVTVDGREVAITCIHVGVDLPRVDDIFRTESTAAEILHWKAKFPNKVVVAGLVEGCDSFCHSHSYVSVWLFARRN